LYFWNGAEWVKVATGSIIPEIDEQPSFPLAWSNGELYYWTGTEWVKINIGDIPEYDNENELPPDGPGDALPIAVVNGEFYYWNGEKWIKISNADIPDYPELPPDGPDGGGGGLPPGGGFPFVKIGDNIYYWDQTKWVEVVISDVPVYIALPAIGASLEIPLAKKGDDFYWWNDTKWVKISLLDIPGYNALPPGGPIQSIVAVRGGELYFWSDTTLKWEKVITSSDITEITEAIYNDLSNYITNITNINGGGGGGSAGTGLTYHDAVLGIVNAIPQMSEGDRYLLSIEGDDIADTTVKETETLHSALTSKSAQSYYSRPFTKNGVTLVGETILSGNIASFASEKMDSFIEFNGNVYSIGKNSSKLYRFNFTTKSYEAEGPTVAREASSFAQSLFVFDNKLWFNAGSGNQVVWSHINSGGQVTVASTFTVSGDTKQFNKSAVVYQDKLHIFGSSGLWTLNAGASTPTHVNNTLFDNSNFGTDTVVVFNNKIWVGLRGSAVSYDGSAVAEYVIPNTGGGSINKLFVWDGELFTATAEKIWKLNGNAFTEFKTVTILSAATVWDGLLYLYGEFGGSMALITLDKSGTKKVVFNGWGSAGLTSDDGILIVKEPTGQIIVEKQYYKTISGSPGELLEIKIVGRNANGQYDEPFGEGHRVVVKTSPTGLSREYGIRNGELIDADGSDNNAIIGNVDTHADLLALATTNIKIGDGYVVEHDENHNDNSAIYTWDGTSWNFTHLWEIQVGSLNTNNTEAQTANGSESFSGTINLHKISKTGSYSDLIGAPTIWSGTQEQYDAIVSKVNTTIYMIFNP
jgi:hypothetical protein